MLRAEHLGFQPPLTQWPALVPVIICFSSSQMPFLGLRTPRGNRSESLDIHPSLSDRCLPISLTLLESYYELPGCCNAPLRTVLGSLGSAWLPYHLLADTATDWSYASPPALTNIAAVKLWVVRGKNLERHVITSIMMMIAAAYLKPLRVANGAVGASTS